jgi:hypothetical protein
VNEQAYAGATANCLAVSVQKGAGIKKAANAAFLFTDQN